MNLELKKRMLSLAISVLGVFISFVVYSCASDEYELPDNEIAHRKDLKTTRSITMDDKLTAIAESDEFIDFLISAKQLIEKVDAYKASLNKNELVDYNVEDILENVNIENELNHLKESRNNLHANTLFSELNEIERFDLFNDYTSVECSLLKTREEGGKEDDCYRKLQDGYKKAQTLYEVYLSCCETEDLINCAREAIKVRDNARERADYDYVICMGV
ncbi:hypothetical protein [Bacteroides thetaiotaomicron]|jgi:hypothetical protein|uniref:hypothetical protein n=1 Tax=Bacteroides thetaiotaomicron TaxID=818 RepID=UPI0018A1B363|nr:hypothetical protein [Bacteroides thetaiotaomicron]MDC2231152.1 hypothetical protein [Bacteroides thetaiotaomicron]